MFDSIKELVKIEDESVAKKVFSKIKNCNIRRFSYMNIEVIRFFISAS